MTPSRGLPPLFPIKPPPEVLMKALTEAFGEVVVKGPWRHPVLEMEYWDLVPLPGAHVEVFRDGSIGLRLKPALDDGIEATMGLHIPGFSFDARRIASQVGAYHRHAAFHCRPL